MNPASELVKRDEVVEAMLAGIQRYLDSLSDDEVKLKAATAFKDIEEASIEQPNSEWHEACFAGAMVYAKEMNKRGLTLTDRTA